MDLANEMSCDHEVYVITYRQKAECDFYRPYLSQKVHQIDYKGTNVIWNKFFQLLVVAYYIFKIRPDIVHTHMIALHTVIIPSLFLRKVKFFHTVHSLADKDTSLGLAAKIRKIFFKKRIKAITISNQCEQSFKEFYDYNSFKMIENGCRKMKMTTSFHEAKSEVLALKHSKSTKIFVCVARIMPVKNHMLLVKTFNKLYERGIDYELIFIGEYEGHKALKESLDKEIKTDRVHFLGPRHNVDDYLFLSDYFCLGSLWEGMPISILEAGMSGCYPICTPVGGVVDIIKDDKWGMLSKDVTEEAYTEAVLKALEKDINRQTLIELYEGKYSVNHSAERYLTAYKEA